MNIDFTYSLKDAPLLLFGEMCWLAGQTHEGMLELLSIQLNGKALKHLGVL